MALPKEVQDAIAVLVEYMNESPEGEGYTEDDLAAMALDDLKGLAAEYGLEVSGRGKQPYVEAILEAQESGETGGGDEESFTDIGARADEEEQDAIDAMTEAATANDLDPDEYPTWVSLGEALDELAAGGDEEDIASLGEEADADDADAIDRLTELAGEADLDVNDYPTWVELATALAEGSGGEGGGEDEPDLEALGEAADGEDQEAIDQLTELAGEASLDPDDYDTWVALAEAIAEAAGSGELTEEEIRGMSLADLKSLATEQQVKITPGMKKDAIIEAILEAASE